MYPEFFKGGVTLCQTKGTHQFRYLNIVRCLLRKSLTKNRCAQDFISLYDVSNLFRGWPASNTTINFRNIGDVNHLTEQSIILFTAQALSLASLPVLLNP